ncbi:lipoprotein [Paractinoplanes abujensis]|uniref:Lipoprotein n=1 Tax=Paractinoplanes abujensis TaxID=882441 RepID=A0A7W7CPG5_9ACTN|nr:hypothetical protein [Actinoplanes abujensis]MBB4692311.1 hypothetical protein [Actinoplanes abujensis]GID24211.1 lipoprotein [Actinoplanes abujensis]
MKSRLVGALAGLTTAALLATGCAGQKDEGATFEEPAAAPKGNGVEALEGAQILEKAKAALAQSKSFHLKGSMKAEEGKIGLDFKVAGEEVLGTMSLDGPRVKLLAVDGKKYIKPDAAFWKMTGGEQGPAVAQLIGDRWVLVKASDKSFESMFTITDIGELLDADGPVTKGATKDIDGKPAIGLTDGGADSDGTLYVATTGEPLPLKLEGPTPADGALTFSEYGETFADIKAPAAADVVDLDKLKK